MKVASEIRETPILFGEFFSKKLTEGLTLTRLLLLADAIIVLWLPMPKSDYSGAAEPPVRRSESH